MARKHFYSEADIPTQLSLRAANLWPMLVTVLSVDHHSDRKCSPGGRLIYKREIITCASIPFKLATGPNRQLLFDDPCPGSDFLFSSEMSRSLSKLLLYHRRSGCDIGFAVPTRAEGRWGKCFSSSRVLWYGFFKKNISVIYMISLILMSEPWAQKYNPRKGVKNQTLT